MPVGTQFLRYSTVGLLSNVLLYCLYLLATEAGIGPKTAMTALYLAGILITFLFNRNWSFGHDGFITAALIRYLLIYLLGYAVNWLALHLLVDRVGMPHQWVQGAMILFVAISLFLLQKYWIFKPQVNA